MKFNIKSVTNPRWANRSKTLIDCDVIFEELGSEVLPFTASPNDNEEHGREIFAKAVNGDYGTVSEFSTPKIDLSVVETALRDERNARLANTDWTQSADVPQSTKDAWAPYRTALRDFTAQNGFPWYSDVVVESDFRDEIDISKAPWPKSP